MRRIQRRMQLVQLETFTDYIDYLEVHPEEFGHLFNMILINVTDFFRDATAWNYIASEIIPKIIQSKKPTDPIRIWSAGCASGEEAYTIAILLAEALGIEAFRERVKIYASDVDEEALSQARLATYTTSQIASVPPELLHKYFEVSEHRCVFRKDLRRSVIFGRHDLFQDAPISRVDLLVCRNVLMYFNAESQSRILARFHFALNSTGFLFLGKAEMLFSHGNLFLPVEPKRRVFSKVMQANYRERITVLETDEPMLEIPVARYGRYYAAAFDSSITAQIVLDLNGSVMLANESARTLLNITPRDIGHSFHDLDVAYRLTDLRNAIKEAYTVPRTLLVRDITLSEGSTQRYFDVTFSPLIQKDKAILGMCITFIDATRIKKLESDLELADQARETAYEELQSTNEELETTNEELQSTVEELETTNEELQSTNEELETINEELQSTNEELQTINEELRRRTEELNQVNAFMESVLTSMRGGVVVVDKQINVTVWNHQAEDLWGLRPNEVIGKNFLNLDIGLPVEQLKPMIRTCLANPKHFEAITLTATNRRGKTIQCRVSCTPLLPPGDGVDGVILLMEEV
jgi:two-component system, chemotaxis family, CheB/CheR fusion protein